MVKIDMLGYFEPYRVTPPAIIPDIDSNRKKFCTYSVIAPTVSDGISWMSDNPDKVKFRGLYKYFVPKKWLMQLYGFGNKPIIPDGENEITNVLSDKLKTGNLLNVDGVTSYLVNSTSRPLRDMNVLVEANFIAEQIFNNPKDRRVNAIKVKDWIVKLTDYYDKAFNAPGFLGKYTKHLTIIPISLWFNTDELMNVEVIFKKINKNKMAQFMMQLTSVENLRKLYDVILIDGKNIMRMSTNMIPDTAKGKESEYIKDSMTQFLRRCYLSRTKVSAVEPDPVEDEVEEEKRDKVVGNAEHSANVDNNVDKILASSRIDADTVTPETKEKLSAAVSSTIVDKNPAGVNPDTDLNDEVSDILYRAKMEGRSVASVKRNDMLREKYKDLTIGSRKIIDIIADGEKYEITPIKIRAHTVNKNLQQNKAHELERAYNENLAQYDLANILTHFSHITPAVMLNTINVSDASTPTDRLIRYDVQFEDENRGRHKFHFLMPKMYRDKYLYLNDMEMNISHQKFPFPITKTAPDRVQLVTNYNKLFSERYGTNLSPRITKIKKILSMGDTANTISIERGDSTILNQMELTTVEYDDLASIMTKLQCGKRGGDIINVYFVVDHARAAVLTEAPKKVKHTTTDAEGAVTVEYVEDNTLLPLAVRNKKSSSTKDYYFISGKTNQVFDTVGECYGELSEFITNLMIEADPTLESKFDSTTTGTRFVYSRTKIMGEWLPSVIVAAAADPGGLSEVMKKAKIKYVFTEKRPKVDSDATGVIPFSDGYLAYDRYPYENSLLMNGLLIVPTREYAFTDFGMRDTFVELFDLMVGRRAIIDGIQNFYYLMVDPITKDILEQLNMPTDFTTLLLYCVGTLSDNTFQIDSNYNNSRVRSNEIINVYLYKALATAWEMWRMGRAEKFSIREDAVIKALMEVQIVDPHSKLNVTLEAENDSLVKLKGPVGMNEDHSFTLEKRAYHPSMAGVVAMNSTPSGEVGIGRHLTLNANIENARGFVKLNKDDYDGTELASAGELLQVFAVESSDIERVAMSISQAKHLVPVSKQTSNLITYDMDRTIPYISNDFAFRTKQAGKVLKIENDIMIVEYKDGTMEDVDLSRHPDKNIDGGFYIMNKMEPLLKEGQRFDENEIVAIDPKYINTNDMFGEPCANIGALARVAFVTNGGVYEDSGYITDKFAHDMATRITTQKRVILSKFANINYIVNVGQEITANEPLMTFDDTEDEFSSQLLQSIAEESEDDDEIIATNAPIISKVTGVVTDIMVYYTIDPSEMTPSVRKIVEKYTNKEDKRRKTLSKYIKPSDSNTILRPTEKLIPDSLGKVKGVQLGEGVMIDFYIEYLDVMAPGDKASVTALKCTQSFIIPQKYAPYTESNPDRPIDMAISCIGMYKRMCLDVIKTGAPTKLLIELKRRHKDKYLERIRKELKK